MDEQVYQRTQWSSCRTQIIGCEMRLTLILAKTAGISWWDGVLDRKIFLILAGLDYHHVNFKMRQCCTNFNLIVKLIVAPINMCD